MFIRCKILLSQGTESLEVTMDKAIGRAFQGGFSQWGPFSSPDEGGSSPGGTMTSRKGWVHELAKRELRLLDTGGPGSGQVGGGLKFGGLAALEPSAILSDAIMTPRGVEPIRSSGRGKLVHPGELSVRLHQGVVSWRLLAFQGHSSTAWISP